MENSSATTLKAPSKKWLKKRAQILDIAAEMFAAKGYEATSLKDIAERLDMQRPSLQYYFKDKADLIDNIIYDINIDISNRFKIESVDVSEGSKVDFLSTIWAEYFLSNPASATILLRQAIDPQFPRSKKTHLSLILLLSALNSDENQSVRAQGVFHSFAAIFFSAVWVAIRDATLRSTGYDLLSSDGKAFMRSIIDRISFEQP